MLRSVLEGRGEMLEGGSTPLRGGVVGFPRIRLVDRQSKLTQAPIYTLSSNKVRGTISSGNNLGSSRLGNCPTSFDERRYFSGADRFIPQRRHQNLDAMNYNHTKVPLLDTQDDHDMPDPTEYLNKSWRKVALKNAMIRANVIPGLEEQRIYNFADRENRHPMAKVLSPESWFDIPGNSKARNRPLIGHSKFIIKVRTSARTWPTTETLDWGARNLIAVVVDGPVDSSVSIFDAATSNIGTITQPVIKLAECTTGIIAIKWNHRGDRIAVVTEHSELRVYSMEKIVWVRKCSCEEVTDERICAVSIVAWTQSDDAIVICCDKNRISSYTYSGELTRTFIPVLMNHTDSISCMAFSMNDRYYAFKTFGSVRVHTWPGFAQVLDVDLRWSGEEPDLCPIMSLAWHPWDMNILCIGVHPFISLYDIQRAKVLCWKRALPGLFVDEIAWNKLSGELVVRFNHREGNQSRSTVAVLSSFNRIVDIVYSGYPVSGLIWSPDNTELGTARRYHVKVWNFFGNETRKWREAHEKSEISKKKFYVLTRRRNIFTDQTRHFEHYTIR